MTGRKFLRSLMACGVSLSVVTQGAYAEACWLFQNRTTTNYAPVAACAPACAPAPQVCSYQPQTCYRTVYVNTPVTTYQPVGGTDPCTGCPTTCMRPVTTYVSQARMVPYTTYRPVFSPAATCNTCNYSPVACGAPACATGACGQTVGYAPAVTYQPAVSIARPACSSCATTNYTPITPAATGGLNITPTTGAPVLGSTTTTFQSVAPATRAVQTPLVQSAPVQSPTISSTVTPSTPSTFGAVGSTVPSLNGSVVGSSTITRVQPESTQQVPASRLAPANSTFKDENAAEPKQDDSHLKPIPDTASENRKTNTAIPHSDNPDRTTSYPIQRAWSYTPVAKSESARTEHQKPSTVRSTDKAEQLDAKQLDAKQLDDSGWRAARR